jgi:type 1 glutamine amidotransferase
MKRFLSCTLLIFIAFASFSQGQRVLLFCKTAGFHHNSIPAGIDAIQKIGAANGFSVDTTTNASLFNPGNLSKYTALVFLNTTGDLFGETQQQALQEYVEGGGGIIGIHAATDAEYNWPWYGKAMGGYFESHPKQQRAKLKVVEASHPATKGLPAEWTRFDEWYNFKNLNPDVHVLLQLDETSYEGGKNGANHPAAWWQNVGKGRIFYTALGHTDESYSEPLFLQHLTGGILFVLQRKA